MSELSQMHCEPCRGGVPPLDAAGVAELEPQLGKILGNIRTHEVDGLTRWDLVLAAKLDGLAD